MGNTGRPQTPSNLLPLPTFQQHLAAHDSEHLKAYEAARAASLAFSAVAAFLCFAVLLLVIAFLITIGAIN